MTSPLRSRLLQASDFGQACAIMAAYFSEIARRHARECVAARVPFDSAFWPECVRRAQTAARIHAAYQQKAREAAAKRMQEEDLEEFALALLSSDFAQHLDLPDATGGIDGLLTNSPGLRAKTHPPTS